MGESEAGDGTGYDSVTTESTRIEAVEGDGAGCVLAEVTETEACDRAGLVDQAAESEGTDRRTDSIRGGGSYIGLVRPKPHPLRVCQGDHKTKLWFM